MVAGELRILWLHGPYLLRKGSSEAVREPPLLGDTGGSLRPSGALLHPLAKLLGGVHRAH